MAKFWGKLFAFAHDVEQTRTGTRFEPTCRLRRIRANTGGYNTRAFPLSRHFIDNPAGRPCCAMLGTYTHGRPESHKEPLMEERSLPHFKEEETEAQREVTGLALNLPARKWLRARSL